MDIMGKLLASQNKLVVQLSRGQQVEGEIVSLTQKEIILDLGAKSEGILQRREVSGQDLKPGDKLKVFVVQTENEHGQVVLSLERQTAHLENRAHLRGGRYPDWSKFTQAQNSKAKLQGIVMEVNKGGLIIEVMGVRGFLPNSQVGFDLLSKSSGGMETLIGKTLQLTVIEIDQPNNKLIFSQRGVISEDIKQQLKSFKIDQKAKGKIVAILPFGLVVDIGGIEGLVFISS